MMTHLALLAKELRSDLLSQKFLAALSAGVTGGLGLLVAQIAFGTFIFSGSLASYSSQGVGLILFGNFATCLIMSLVGGYRGVIAGLSPALVIGMAVFGSSIDAEGDALFITVSATLILTAFVTGVACLLIGQYRIANLLRFIPYPVSAGFVAGIGGAVCLAAMAMMGAEFRWITTTELFEMSSLSRWVPGVAYGAGLYFALKRWRNSLILPISAALFIGGYHLVLTILNIPVAEANELGLLLTSTADGGLWPPFGAADIQHLHWIEMAAQIPNMLALIIVAFICVIMNIAGLEVAANQELDWNREFKACGFASTIAGLGGGTVATIVVPISLRSKLFGATTRFTGMFAALVIGVALLVGDGMLELVPSSLVGGMLVFAGLGMLDEGLVRSYRRLTWSEFSIIVLIFVAINTFGLLEGVGVGMLASLVFFAVRLSRVNPIESRFTSRDRQSSKSRSIPERVILLERGHGVHAYRVRGYIFFGSAALLADRLRESLNARVRPYCLLLDFENVSGFDFSAVNVLSRVLQAANSAGVRVVLSAPSNALEIGLARTLPPSAFKELCLVANLDLALESCEDSVIEAWRSDSPKGDEHRTQLLQQSADELERYLNRQIDFEELVADLSGVLESIDYSPGETLAKMASEEAGIQLLVSGRASAYDATGARLYQREPGDTVLPIDALESRVASVLAEQPCKTLLLTPSARRYLESNMLELALKLYRYLLDGHTKVKADEA